MSGEIRKELYKEKIDDEVKKEKKQKNKFFIPMVILFIILVILIISLIINNHINDLNNNKYTEGKIAYEDLDKNENVFIIYVEENKDDIGPYVKVIYKDGQIVSGYSFMEYDIESKEEHKEEQSSGFTKGTMYSYIEKDKKVDEKIINEIKEKINNINLYDLNNTYKYYDLDLNEKIDSKKYFGIYVRDTNNKNKEKQIRIDNVNKDTEDKQDEVTEELLELINMIISL